MNMLMGILVFIFGSVIGSFLNVVILRLPKGETLYGRSHCPRCGYELGPLDLVPLLSFLVLGRKCRSCRRPISWRYFSIEAVTGLLFVLVWLAASPADAVGYLALLRNFSIAATLVVVFIVDFEHYLILDKVLLFSGAAVAVFNITLDLVTKTSFFSLYSHTGGGVVAAFLASLPFYLIWRFSQGRWMGFGDVKFMVFLGFAMGWPLVWVNWLLAFWFGAIFSIALLLAGRKTWQSRLPFGTFLSVAALAAMLIGKPLLNWYLALVGF